VNRPIRVLAVFCGVLFLALLLNANYVQFVIADDLNSRNGNRRVIDEEFSRERGEILVAARRVARSVESDDEFDYQRVYNQPELYAHLTGFYSYLFGASDLELAANPILSGSDPRLFVNRVIDLVGSQQPAGGSVQLTINPGVQQAALAGLQSLPGEPRGAVVALDPATGAVLAMVSTPSYNPNALASHDLESSQQAYQELTGREDEPLLDRTRENTYSPGSTFKLVTAAAALESGDYTPETQVPGGPTLDLPDTDNTLTNDVSACDVGQVTLTFALAFSCNVSFGDVGLKLGNDALRAQAERFGFNDSSFFDDLRLVPSSYPEGAEGPFVAYNAIGQFDVSATPLQMAMVAAGIANDGDVMRPVRRGRGPLPEPRPARAHRARGAQRGGVVRRRRAAHADDGRLSSSREPLTRRRSRASRWPRRREPPSARRSCPRTPGSSPSLPPTTPRSPSRSSSRTPRSRGRRSPAGAWRGRSRTR
jgi:peptidoglycan glycosyltransferase